MTTLKIHPVDGTIEIEGSEEFVREMYTELKDKLFATTKAQVPPGGRQAPSETRQAPAKNTTPKKAKRARSGVGSYKIVPIGDVESLKQLYKDKQPRSGYEKNVVFVYFLEKIANLSNINLDMIYTCYHTVGAKPANALRQNVYETSAAKKWVNTSDIEDVKLTHIGTTFVDHDLPAANTAA